MMGIFADISARKKSEQALRESEEKYRQLFSSELDAIMVFDAETKQFIDVNNACEKMYGYNREEFLNLKITDISSEQSKTMDSIKKAMVILYLLPKLKELLT